MNHDDIALAARPRPGAAEVTAGACACAGVAVNDTTAATAAAWRELHTRACAPYRQAGRFAWHFARGKLGRDPVFRGLLERGDLPAGARVVDIGCGQGLMANLLQACAELANAGGWPQAWPPPPRARSYHGIELMPRDVERARRATAGPAPGLQAQEPMAGGPLAHGPLALAPTFECNDMRRAALPPCELVVILDVLHYVNHAAQSALLTRVRNALLQGRRDPAVQPHGGGEHSPPARRGRLLLRVGDAASTRGFVLSQWVDRAVTLLRGHAVPPTWGRPLAGWVALLREFGFEVKTIPMSRGTPFANVLLVADLVGQA